MAALFWAVVTSYIALSVIAIVLIAALIVGYIPFGKYFPFIGQYVKEAQLLAFLLFGLLCALVDHRIADESADLRDMHRKLEQANIDLEFSDKQLAIQKQTADDAQKLRDQAKAKADDANEKLEEYKAELAKRPPDRNCYLTDDDLRRLRAIAH